MDVDAIRNAMNEMMKVSEAYAQDRGNILNGVNDELIDESDILVKIPIYGNAESLNAAISLGIGL